MDDILVACMDLIERCGASDFEIGYLNEDAEKMEDAEWYAQAQFRGTRIMVGERHSPEEAALALARRMMLGAYCRCGERVTMNKEINGCLWRLMGDKWIPSCDVPSIKIKDGQRGDLEAINAHFEARRKR